MKATVKVIINKTNNMLAVTDGKNTRHRKISNYDNAVDTIVNEFCYKYHPYDDISIKFKYIRE